MDAYHQDLRRSADKAFMESLNQLEDVLLEEHPTSASGSSVGNTRTEQPLQDDLYLDLEALEDADADIEAFMQRRSQNRS